jgi:hypothetical protein
MQGFTKHVINCIEEYLASDKGAMYLKVPEPEKSEPEPKAEMPRYTWKTLTYCPCGGKCEYHVDHDKHMYFYTCPDCGKTYDGRDDTLIWKQERITSEEQQECS